MVKFDDQMTRTFFEHRCSDQLIELMTSDNSLAVEVTGEKAIQTINMIAGPENPAVAKQQAPKSWRSVYGTAGASNAIHVSDNATAHKREADYIFSDTVRIQGFTAMLNNCSLCLIKPHALPQAGAIIDRILDEGYEISAMQS